MNNQDLNITVNLSKHIQDAKKAGRNDKSAEKKSKSVEKKDKSAERKQKGSKPVESSG